ncbi:MAG: YwaF family protein [Oscillospiraceae bacterium]|nr:YwaF family protein [Oscillospiraceae bacterium]
MSVIKEFFGFGGYSRPAEGAMSWQHLTFVTSLVVVMTLLAVFFGLRNRNKSLKIKNRCLIVAALLIDSFEILKITVMCLRAKDPMGWITELPLFLCSIQLITIPLAAFSKGRIKEASLDFVTIFGLLGALLGTYAATQNYGCYPVLSMDNVISGITHCISGFSALYIMVSGMSNMKKKNIPITLAILFGFCIAAYAANVYLDYNYMFLMRGDGTPYDILFNLVGGHSVLYPLSVVALFVIYISAFYAVYFAIKKKSKK